MAGQAQRYMRTYCTCPTCGTDAYDTRKKARRAAKALHPQDHLRAYRCESDLWHLKQPTIHPEQAGRTSTHPDAAP